MRTAIALLLMLGFVVTASGLGTGCQQSTRVDVEDDEEGPAGSGPYAGDAKEVTEKIVSEVKRQRVIEDFKAQYKEPPIVWVIRPVNKTRFVEVTDYFVADLMTALQETFPRSDMRFVQRDSETLSEIEKEKLDKEAGEVTDRTGRRTRLGADFFIRAEFVALSRSDGKEEDDAIKYTYQFIDTETSEVLFRSSHDIRRVSSRKVIYR
jgi:hypothetical protein